MKGYEIKMPCRVILASSRVYIGETIRVGSRKIIFGISEVCDLFMPGSKITVEMLWPI